MDAFAAHTIIRLIRHVFTALSIFSSVPAVITTLLCAHATSTTYAANTTLIVLIGVASDVILQLIWDPLYLLPQTCIIRQNPLFAIPGTAPFYCEIWVGVTSMMGAPIAACFVNRHQASLAPGSPWHIPRGLRFAIFFTFAIMAIFVAYLLRIAEQFDVTAELEAATNNWPKIPIEVIGCFNRNVYFAVLVFIVVALFGAGASISFLALHTFSQLGKISVMSDTTKAFHMTMTRSLVPLLLIIFPIICIAAAIILGAGGPLPFSICLLFTSAHSPVHSTILLTLTPVYRKRMLKLFSKTKVISLRMGGSTHN